MSFPTLRVSEIVSWRSTYLSSCFSYHKFGPSASQFKKGIPFIKFVVVGDNGVGKTCLLISLLIGKFPEEYIPSVFDVYEETYFLEKRPYRVSFWDTARYDSYSERIRPLSYVHCNAFLLTFSVVDPYSFQRVNEKWYPEVSYHAPQAQIILIGTKSDLRTDEKTIQQLSKNGQTMVTYEEGEALAKQIKAVKYLECSALTQEGLKQVLVEAVNACKGHHRTESKGFFGRIKKLFH